ncbi:MAG: 4Fe-4S dicluster domain-containing protein [Planctomycetota bacterium]|nr:4Fe-4S dicluster domain-containing protein [Planctomycetota bacterium]
MEGGLELCNACGACSAVCPMWVFYPDFPFTHTPRAIIRRIALGESLDKIEGFSFCLECSACERHCPQGVRFREILPLTALKRIYCKSCGAEIRGETPIRQLEKLTNRQITLCQKCSRQSIADKLRRFSPNPIAPRIVPQ